MHYKNINYKLKSHNNDTFKRTNWILSVDSLEMSRKQKKSFFFFYKKIKKLSPTIFLRCSLITATLFI